MQVVNGYVCMNCSDVAKAKRTLDPAGGPTPPERAHSPRADDVAGVNQPLSQGGRGTRINVLL